MPGIILAAPTTAPQFAGMTQQWTHMGHTWTGWDDSVWDLCGDASGVVLLSGVRGLTMPPADRYASASPAVAGSRWRGHRVAEREVFWPVKVWADAGSAAWLAYDRAWWNTMRPDKLGTWAVTQTTGETRSLRLRFVDDGQHSVQVDPGLIGWERYGITLVAEDPYWEGEPISRTWETATPDEFFGTGAPSFFISSGNTLDNAKITNPGDVEAWPVWTLNGPITAAEVGVGGESIEVPFAVADGSSLTIDTDPRAQTAITSAGVDRTEDLGEVGFTAIPAGASIPLALAVTGAGSVSVSVTPRYYRAW